MKTYFKMRKILAAVLFIVAIVCYTNIAADNHQQRFFALCEETPSHPYCLAL